MNSDNTRDKYIEEISSTEIDNSNHFSIKYNFINGAYVELNGNSNETYEVSFFDKCDLVYKTNIKCGNWARANREYFTEWNVFIKDMNGKTIFEKNINLENEKVYIELNSSSIGDTIAWIPYVEEFRKKHKCETIVSTFRNDLFEEQYPMLRFVNPDGKFDEEVHAQYNIGWFYLSDDVDFNKVPFDFKSQPLQKTASDILGIDYEEIRPLLNLPTNIEKQKKVGIAIHGTAQAKYWNNPNGWQEVVDFLNDKGYEVMLYSSEKDLHMGNKHPDGITRFKGGNLQEVIDDMVTCEFFIGIGSGLSWLAWASNLPLVLISGFSDDYTETQSNTFRVINKSSCFGCFNKHRLDPNDWNWCPEFKGTPRQFECSKSITSEMVIDKILLIISEMKLESEGFDWGFFESDKKFKEQQLKEIFIDNIYEKYFEVEEGSIVMDIGSSVGPFAYSVSDKAGHVYCIEPSVEEFPTLEKNLKDKRSTCINRAIGDNNDISTNDEVYGDDKSVQNIKFGDLIKDYNIPNIDFLKIDCEGSEYEVFVEENVEILKSIKYISGEWHLGGLDVNGYPKKERFRYFRDNILPNFENYTIFSVDGVDIKHRLYSEEFLNYYTEVQIYITN